MSEPIDMEKALELARRINLTWPYAHDYEDRMEELAITFARALIACREPVKIVSRVGFAIHRCACGEEQDATKQIRIWFCHWCGRPIQWEGSDVR